MKYIANPVIVDAYEIVSTSMRLGDKNIYLSFNDHNMFNATPEMTSRMIPKPGDYLVVQSDGYEYLNPKEVFERKYRKHFECNEVGCKIVGPHEHEISGPVENVMKGES